MLWLCFCSWFCLRLLLRCCASCPPVATVLFLAARLDGIAAGVVWTCGSCLGRIMGFLPLLFHMHAKGHSSLEPTRMSMDAIPSRPSTPLPFRSPAIVPTRAPIIVLLHHVNAGAGDHARWACRMVPAAPSSTPECPPRPSTPTTQRQSVPVARQPLMHPHPQRGVGGFGGGGRTDPAPSARHCHRPPRPRRWDKAAVADDGRRAVAPPPPPWESVPGASGVPPTGTPT